MLDRRRHRAHLPVGPARVPRGFHRPQQPARQRDLRGLPLQCLSRCRRCWSRSRHVTRYSLRDTGALHHPEPAPDAAVVRGPARRQLAHRGAGHRDGVQLPRRFGNVAHLVTHHRRRTSAIAIIAPRAWSRRRTAPASCAACPRSRPSASTCARRRRRRPTTPSASSRPASRRKGTHRWAARPDARRARRASTIEIGATHAHTSAARRCADGAASARTTPTSSSRRRASLGVRPATSTATSSPGARRRRRPTTPGPRPGSTGSAGSASTPPTASARPSATCASPAASMPPPPPRSAAPGGAARTRPLTSSSKSSSKAAQQ